MRIDVLVGKKFMSFTLTSLKLFLSENVICMSFIISHLLRQWKHNLVIFVILPLFFPIKHSHFVLREFELVNVYDGCCCVGVSSFFRSMKLTLKMSMPVSFLKIELKWYFGYYILFFGDRQGDCEGNSSLCLKL